MIRQWEIVHTPNQRDPHRYRISLNADGSELANFCIALADRLSPAWAPFRKPFNCAFYAYGISNQEKLRLEEILSGKVPLSRARSLIALNGKPARTAARPPVAPAPAESLRLGYFYPMRVADAPLKIHAHLVELSGGEFLNIPLHRAFLMPYQSMAQSDIDRLLKKCKKYAVRHVIAVGETAYMGKLVKTCAEAGIWVRSVDEELSSKNRWLGLLAEMISY